MTRAVQAAQRSPDLDADRPRAEGRNWRGVHRAADTGQTQQMFALQNGRLIAHKVGIAEESQEVLMERYAAKEPSVFHAQWASECSHGPKRASRWGCEPGHSTQYSHAAETWWEASPSVGSRRCLEHRGPPATTSLHKSQRPRRLEEGEEKARPRSPRPPAVFVHGAADNPAVAIEVARYAAKTAVAGCLCGKGACNCSSDTPCMLWPSGRPMRDGNLPPLRGAEAGAGQSLGLSLAPPAATSGKPAWLRVAAIVGDVAPG